MTIETHIAEVLNSPSTSFWLRDALKASLSRDPVDAIKDAEYLTILLQRRHQALAATATTQLPAFTTAEPSVPNPQS